MTNRYDIRMPKTPGATPSVVYSTTTLRDARLRCKALRESRRDLKGQDIRIETTEGQLVEYAGPAR